MRWDWGEWNGVCSPRSAFAPTSQCSRASSTLFVRSKTIQTATYVYTVSQQLATRGPFLIVAPLSTIPHWYREFTGWTDLNTIVYHGSANDRERAREDEFAFPEDQVQDVAFNQRYLTKVAKKWRAAWMRVSSCDCPIAVVRVVVCC